VASRGPSSCDAAIYGDVAAWGNFIIDVAIDAAEEGGYPAPHWTSGSSEAEPFEAPSEIAPAAGDGDSPTLGTDEPTTSNGDDMDLDVDETSGDGAEASDCGSIEECGNGSLSRESACAMPGAMRTGRGVPVGAAIVAGLAFAAALRRRR
jgi:hypothetical protein